MKADVRSGWKVLAHDGRSPHDANMLTAKEKRLAKRGEIGAKMSVEGSPIWGYQEGRKTVL